MPAKKRAFMRSSAQLTSLAPEPGRHGPTSPTRGASWFGSRQDQYVRDAATPPVPPLRALRTSIKVFPSVPEPRPTSFASGYCTSSSVRRAFTKMPICASSRSVRCRAARSLAECASSHGHRQGLSSSRIGGVRADPAPNSVPARVIAVPHGVSACGRAQPGGIAASADDDGSARQNQMQRCKGSQTPPAKHGGPEGVTFSPRPGQDGGRVSRQEAKSELVTSKCLAEQQIFASLNAAEAPATGSEICRRRR